MTIRCPVCKKPAQRLSKRTTPEMGALDLEGYETCHRQGLTWYHQEDTDE